jgi:NADH:ubiquinone oxidoreductase subunit 6 (subunit J)
MKNKIILMWSVFILLGIEAIYPTVISIILMAVTITIPFISMKLRGKSYPEFAQKDSNVKDFLKFDIKNNPVTYSGYALVAGIITVWIATGHLIPDGALGLKALGIILFVDFWVGYPIGYEEMENDKNYNKNK